MAQCNNCKTTLSCGCQNRTASNGVQVCSNCLAQYEQQIAALKNNHTLNKNK
jgi:hypothetical protein